MTAKERRIDPRSFVFSGPASGGILAATASQKIGSFAKFGSVAGCKDTIILSGNHRHAHLCSRTLLHAGRSETGRATFYLNAGVVALSALLLVVFYNP